MVGGSEGTKTLKTILTCPMRIPNLGSNKYTTNAYLNLDYNMITETVKGTKNENYEGRERFPPTASSSCIITSPRQ